jgi:hypothetical protein
MKSFVRLSVALVVTAALASSCKKPIPKQTSHISKDAVFVASINMKGLQSKLAKNQATLENILKSLSGSDTAASKGKQEWEDLKNSGLDLEENFFVSVVQKGGGSIGSASAMLVSGIGTVKDAGKLEAYIKKKHSSANISKGKNYSYTSIEGDNMVAWGDNMVVALSHQQAGSRQMEFDSATGTFNFKSPVNPATNLKLEMDNIFNMKEDQSIASIAEFRDLMQDKSDIGMWMNSGSSLDMIPLPKVKELFAGFTAATLNFEDGKITVDTKTFSSKEMRDIISKYAGTTADMSLVETYPSNNINGFFNINMNPDFIMSLVKYLELGGMADSYLSKFMGSNYTLQDLLKAFKGDFVLVVSDLNIAAAGDTSPGIKMPNIPKMKMIFNATVGDKTQMNRLMDKAVEKGMMVKNGNSYELIPQIRQAGFSVSVDEKYLLVGMDESVINDYRSKTKKASIPEDIANDFKGKQAVLYINIENILNGLPGQGTLAGSDVLPKAKETFKDIKGSGGFTGKATEAHYEIRFKNEKENSLTSLLSFAETASKHVKRHPPMMPGAMDTTTSPVSLQ